MREKSKWSRLWRKEASEGEARMSLGREFQTESRLEGKKLRFNSVFERGRMKRSEEFRVFEENKRGSRLKRAVIV